MIAHFSDIMLKFPEGNQFCKFIKTFTNVLKILQNFRNFEKSVYFLAAIAHLYLEALQSQSLTDGATLGQSTINQSICKVEAQNFAW